MNSNGGTSIYRRIIENDNYNDLNIIGNIIDSAPGKRRLMNGIKALNSALTAMKISTLSKYTHLCFFILRSIFKVFWHKIFGRNELIFEYLKNLPQKWDEAYIFSKKDDIIFYKDVKELVEHRKKQNKSNHHVKSLELDDSEHVQHFRKYPKNYIDFCYNFLDDAYVKFYQNSKL